MKKLLLIAILGLSGLLFSQTICTGTIEQCREAQKRLCADEKAPANLDLADAKTVIGTVLDQTGAKFERGVAVQLRSPKSGAVLRTATVGDGDFSLGELQPGLYRLIVVKIGASSPERLKMFDQPQRLICQDAGSRCSLTVMPIVHGSDNPIDFCPPK